jgi:hypothetical protein
VCDSIASVFKKLVPIGRSEFRDIYKSWNIKNKIYLYKTVMSFDEQMYGDAKADLSIVFFSQK